jgi:hypothetical protein
MVYLILSKRKTIVTLCDIRATIADKLELKSRHNYCNNVQGKENMTYLLAKFCLYCYSMALLYNARLVPAFFSFPFMLDNRRKQKQFIKSVSIC